MTTKTNTTKSTNGKSTMAKANKKQLVTNNHITSFVATVNAIHDVKPTIEVKQPLLNELDSIINEINETVVKNEAVTQEPITIKKTTLAQKVFDDEVQKAGGNPPRAATIKRMMEECNLTKPGASTYFQNMKKAAGFVTARV